MPFVPPLDTGQNPWVELDLTGSGAGETALVEGSDDGGTTWFTLRYGLNVPLNGPSNTATIFDWEPFPNTPRLYRITVTDNTGNISPPSAPMTGTVAPDRFWLLDVTNPTSDAAGNPAHVGVQRLRGTSGGAGNVGTTVDWEENEPQSITYGLDERMPVVTRGALQGLTTSLTFYVPDYATYLAIRALRARQKTLRLCSNAKEAWYVTIGGKVTYSPIRGFDPTNAGYAVTIPFIESASPS